MAQYICKGLRRLQPFFNHGVIDLNPSNVSLIILTVTALFPVEAWQTVITLGPCGAIFTLAEACTVTPIMNRTHLVAVTL